MTLTLLNTWIELQDIECPPHLRPKRIIDRLGRRTYRCVTPDDTVANVTIEGVPEEDKKKFSLGRKPVNAQHTFEWSGKVTNSSAVEFLRLLNDEGLNSDYSELIESYLNYPDWDVMGIPDNPEASDKMNLLRNKLNYHILLKKQLSKNRGKTRNSCPQITQISPIIRKKILDAGKR